MKIFYYWESPTGIEMPAYLQLCVETWRRACPDAEIVRVDLGNLSDLSGGRVSAGELGRFSYPLQSDIAAVAVLLEQPGLFMDADIVLLPNFDPGRYSDSKLTMYGYSIEEGNHPTGFFFTGLPGNPLLEAWLDEAKARIAQKSSYLWTLRSWLRRRVRGKPIKVPWYYLGNGILDDLLRRQDWSDLLDLRDAYSTGFYTTSRIQRKFPELERYEDVWFDRELPVSEVVEASREGIVFLQNSWHPAEYRAMPREAVLSDDALVSRLIAHSLT